MSKDKSPYILGNLVSITNMCYIYMIESKTVKDTLQHEYCVNVVREELEQFVTNDVWELVEKTNNLNLICRKWIYKNKTNENGVVVRNKVRLAAQG